MEAKKSLGQNFLVDNNIINKIVGEITSDSNDLIVEIGIFLLDKKEKINLWINLSLN